MLEKFLVAKDLFELIQYLPVGLMKVIFLGGWQIMFGKSLLMGLIKDLW